MSSEQLSQSPLGKSSTYVNKYDPGQLCPLPRGEIWRDYGFNSAPWTGVDIWNAWEISWLNDKGLPQVAVAEIRVNADSASIIESKSLKLYLNSFSHSRYESINDVREAIERDLSSCVQSDVNVELQSLQENLMATREIEGSCIDARDVCISDYQRNADLLTVGDSTVTGETLFSHLLRTNCPVTGQPDWGSVVVHYSGPVIDQDGLLKYIVSFRDECDFHEQCTETMFLDITQRCQPSELTVYTRYLRRGGLDINPWRSNCGATPINTRLSRQ